MGEIPEDSEEAQWLRNFERLRPQFERNELEFIEWLKQHGKLRADGQNGDKK